MHAQLTMLNADLCALERENTELPEELNKHQQGRDDSMSVLLVGSSIIRDISSKDDAKLQVKSPSGAKLDDIHHEIGRRKEKYSHQRAERPNMDIFSMTTPTYRAAAYKG